jgi:hypothetical protein
MSNWTVTFKKLHRWPGLIISFVLLYYGITGIFMNHRELFSSVDVSLKLLPDNYEYRNWNNAALKGNLVLSPDSILIYGNIGVWLTDSTFKRYTPFNSGFPAGSDNRKISDLHATDGGDLYAASLFGLYAFDFEDAIWVKIGHVEELERFVSIESSGDTLYALSRSYLYTGLSEGTVTSLKRIELPAPTGFESKVTLFQTLWQIHSGEIFGIPGKLFVDLIGVITVFLSVTGIIYFFFPGWIKRRARRDMSYHRIAGVNKWSLKWHNKVGAWTFILLVILFFTGMFLRPPLLIAIANAKVAPLKYSHLDQPNPWYDKLRDLLIDQGTGNLMFSTLDGMYFSDRNLKTISSFQYQPPVSVMGITSFSKFNDDTFIVGSFSGLFLWNPNRPEIFDYTSGNLYTGNTGGRPIGEFKVTGTIKDYSGRLFMIDYGKGILPLWHDGSFPAMPANILEDSKMSLWNFALEIHTGRIFENITGGFYILIVPLAGLTGITVVISGYLLWRRKYRRLGIS